MRNLEKLNQTLTEFYDKMSSWEQSVVKETGYSLAQIHTIEVLGCHGALRMKETGRKAWHHNRYANGADRKTGQSRVD